MRERSLEHIPAEKREQIEQRSPSRSLVTPEDAVLAIVFVAARANPESPQKLPVSPGERKSISWR